MTDFLSSRCEALWKDKKSVVITWSLHCLQKWAGLKVSYICAIYYSNSKVEIDKHKEKLNAELQKCSVSSIKELNTRQSLETAFKNKNHLVVKADLYHFI